MVSTQVPSETKALLQTSLTPPVLTLTTLPTPVPQLPMNEHLIRVHATALCARELLWPSFFPSPSTTKLLVPGYDLSGTVVAAPPASPFQPGTRVHCRTNYFRTGNAREYTIALGSELAKIPDNLDFIEGASVPLSAETAWQALFVQGGLPAEEGGSKGKRVLVSAAAGGVGIWVIQLAKWAGAEVIAVCGPDNVAFVKELGADEVVNYREAGAWEKWAAANKKADLVVDGVGGASLEQVWLTVKEGGRLLSIVEPPEERKPKTGVEKDVRAWFFVMESVGEQLAKINELIEKGICKTVVDSVFKLEEFEEAVKKVDGGHARGKVVLKVID